MHHTNFVHLHLHTKYSLLDGAIRLDELFEMAREYKMPAVAMTDHGNMFGAVEFYRKAMKYGIKPIVGCEVYVAPRSRFDKTPSARRGPSETASHLILLVMNITGYKNLCRLVTAGYLEGFYYKPRIDKELLKECNEGLIALSACLHGELGLLLCSGQTEKALEVASEFKEIFSERRFFLEMQENGIDEQKKLNQKLMEISKQLDIPLVATNDCHYLKREDARAHDALLCIQTGKRVNEQDRLKFSTDEFYFKSHKEMTDAFSYSEEAIRNSIEIAERCNLQLTLGKPELPEFPLPEGEDVNACLEKLARKGLDERLEGSNPKEAISEPDRWCYYERIEKELNIIRNMGFSGYFLIVADLIQYARDCGIPVGPGRGSAAGSLVAYSLKITAIDPICYNLLFERFLNPDRVSLPDIDIDFCYEGRDQVIRYVTDKYGTDNVTQIITFGQMKARAVIRDVGRVLDIPYADVDKIAKMIPQILNITIDDAIKQVPELKNLLKDDPKVNELIDIAKSLEGLTRHASTHAAGVVISNRPLVECLPLYRGVKDNVVTTQYAMKDVENIGLVKFDFLGLKTLTVIDRAVKLANKNVGVDIDILSIALDDHETYKLMSDGDTVGVFQLESSGMKDMLCKMKPEKFEDLMAAVALYRPGPLQSGMVDDFIKRKNGDLSVAYDTPQLKGILDSTYGVIVYQEQVMEIARVLASYTPGDADILRKAMGKKLSDEMLEQRVKFLEGAKKNKLNKHIAEKTFDLMAHFAGYGFNKSHSAAYALIAYQTAYLKAHYPVEFITALLTSDMGDTDKVIKYIGECKDKKIDILPPNVNKSGRDFSVVDAAIRFGLAAIKNVGLIAIENIISARKDGPFNSLIDFLERTDSRKVNRKVLESLIKSGAFDFSGCRRSQLTAGLDIAMNIAQGLQRSRLEGQVTIFDAIEGGRGLPAVELPTIDEWPEQEKLMHEKEALGFFISGHPLERCATSLRLYSTTDIDGLKENADNKERDQVIGGVVAGLKEVKTKKGDIMVFANIEDLKGNLEVIIFSKLYQKAKEILKSSAPILVKGKVEKTEQNVRLIANDISLLDAVGEGFERQTHITLKIKETGEDVLERLKECLLSHAGRSPVFLHMADNSEEVVIALHDTFKVSPSEEMLDRMHLITTGINVKFRS